MTEREELHPPYDTASLFQGSLQEKLQRVLGNSKQITYRNASGQTVGRGYVPASPSERGFGGDVTPPYPSKQVCYFV